MIWGELALCFTTSAMLSGCLVTHDNPTNGRPDLGSCAPPSAVAYTDVFPSFAIEGDAEAPIPDQVAGYAITSNATGTYTLNWTNGAMDTSTCFNGRITGIDAFANVKGVSGFEVITTLSPTQIGFADAPGTSIDGITFFEQVDPITVDVYIGGDPTTAIYYVDGSAGNDGTTGADPVTFHSP